MYADTALSCPGPLVNPAIQENSAATTLSLHEESLVDFLLAPVVVISAATTLSTVTKVPRQIPILATTDRVYCGHDNAR
jgi:hypothetical protein